MRPPRGAPLAPCLVKPRRRSPRAFRHSNEMIAVFMLYVLRGSCHARPAMPIHTTCLMPGYACSIPPHLGGACFFRQLRHTIETLNITDARPSSSSLLFCSVVMEGGRRQKSAREGREGRQAVEPEDKRRRRTWAGSRRRRAMLRSAAICLSERAQSAHHAMLRACA